MTPMAATATAADLSLVWLIVAAIRRYEQNNGKAWRNV